MMTLADLFEAIGNEISVTEWSEVKSSVLFEWKKVIEDRLSQPQPVAQREAVAWQRRDRITHGGGDAPGWSHWREVGRYEFDEHNGKYPHIEFRELFATPAIPTRDSWTCFQCSETFTEWEDAALHFGTNELQNPACTIDIAAYRAMEAKEARYFDEDADIHRQMHRMANDHQIALRRAEEEGYAKALKDTGYTIPTGHMVVPVNATDKMLEAAIEAHDAECIRGAYDDTWKAGELIRSSMCAAIDAAIAASPSAGGV